MIDTTHYAYRVIWSQEDGEHVALCAEFPSLSFLAQKPEKALSGLMGLVADIVEDMAASGEPIPEPLASKQFSGKFQVRIPPEQHRHLVMHAAEQGISLNRYIASRLSAQ